VDRSTDTVTLKDGRTVEMQELSGLEMMAASRIAKGDPIAVMAVATCYSIVSIEGTKFPRPTTLAEVQAFMSSVSAKDFAKLGTACNNLNIEDPEGEATAAAEP
jgi:hypothetical protein